MFLSASCTFTQCTLKNKKKIKKKKRCHDVCLLDLKWRPQHPDPSFTIPSITELINNKDLIISSSHKFIQTGICLYSAYIERPAWASVHLASLTRVPTCSTRLCLLALWPVCPQFQLLGRWVWFSSISSSSGKSSISFCESMLIFSLCDGNGHHRERFRTQPILRARWVYLTPVTFYLNKSLSVADLYCTLGMETWRHWW